jgi:hypothetical protein
MEVLFTEILNVLEGFIAIIIVVGLFSLCIAGVTLIFNLGEKGVEKIKRHIINVM